jgi:hypothetical protein
MSSNDNTQNQRNSSSDHCHDQIIQLYIRPIDQLCKAAFNQYGKLWIIPEYFQPGSHSWMIIFTNYITSFDCICSITFHLFYTITLFSNTVSNGSWPSLRVRVRVQTEPLPTWRSRSSISPNCVTLVRFHDKLQTSLNWAGCQQVAQRVHL